MGEVFSVNDLPWSELRLAGARGFEYKALSGLGYTAAYNVELVRLEPGDLSVSHVEPWNHLLYLISGRGEVTIEGNTLDIASGSVCLISAGERHSLSNVGSEDMLVLAIYDPPRIRNEPE